MEWALIETFAVLAVLLGAVAWLTTRSAARAVFVSLVCLGIAATGILMLLGVGDVPAFFAGQLIVMGAAYIFVRLLFSSILTHIRDEFRCHSSSCH